MGITALTQELWLHIGVLLHAMQARNEHVSLLQRLYYHTREFHVEPGMDFIQVLADALGVTRDRVSWALFAFAGHDFIQESWLVDRKGFLVREYDPLNELMTGKFLSGMLGGFRASVPKEGKQIVRLGTRATEAKWDAKLGTVRQPRHNPDLPLAARLVPMADLHTVGVNSRKFLQEGQLLYRERNPGIVLRLHECGHPHELSSVEEDRIRTDYLAHLASQATFASGRKTVHEEETADLTDWQKSNLGRIYTEFDRSARYAEAQAKRAKLLRFVPLVRQFYPDAFPEHK